MEKLGGDTVLDLELGRSSRGLRSLNGVVGLQDSQISVFANAFVICHSRRVYIYT